VREWFELALEDTRGARTRSAFEQPEVQQLQVSALACGKTTHLAQSEENLWRLKQQVAVGIERSYNKVHLPEEI
jgi:hypothetical protein